MNPAVNLSRRNLLRGSPGSAAPLRPPGAIPEPLFLDNCTSCGDCIAACPQGIIVHGSGDYPEIDFARGECTFCEHCISACAEDALQLAALPKFSIALQVDDSCLARRQIVCQTCGDACGADAIRFRPQIGQVAVPGVDASLCTGCGACVSVCPKNAIKVLPNA